MKLLDRGFVVILFVLAAISIIIGMVAGPFGYVEMSIGASAAACVFTLAIILHGLITWKRR